MKKSTFFTVLTVCVFLAFSAKSQDMHFTQYVNSPLALNPANAGGFYGDWRVANNYRSQWSGVLDKPITTIAISYDRPFFMENDDRIGLGVQVLNDQAGDNGFMTNRAALSLSYIKLIGLQELRFGFQAAYNMKSFDNDLSFPEGWNPSTGQFESDLVVLEPLDRESASYGDINAGLSWSLNYEVFRPTVGLAAFHLNTPKENFYANNSKVATRVAVHASLLFLMQQEKIFVDPHFLIMSQAKAKNIITGIRGGYRFDPNDLKFQSAYFGLAVRNGFSENADAFIMQAGCGWSNFNLGFSYDFNVSPLKGTQAMVVSRFPLFMLRQVLV